MCVVYVATHPNVRFSLQVLRPATHPNVRPHHSFASSLCRYCAPTRASLLTGRLPYRLAATRANFIPWTLTDGTHLNYTMLPKRLAAANYRSVHIGKWHQGLYTPEYTPVGRGFDHSLGFLEGGEDHNTSKTFGNWCKRGEVDLSYGEAKPGSPAGDPQPWPYSWPHCTSWQTLNGTTLQNFDDPKSVDIRKCKGRVWGGWGVGCDGTTCDLLFAPFP